MIASPNPHKEFIRVSGKRIPNVLVHEIIDGKPYYRKGYREVLAKTKTLEEIMGSSTLQGFIVSYLIGTIWAKLDRKLYHMISNEAGIHLDRRNNLAGDILIFDSEVLTIDMMDTYYAQVPPKISIEVDVKVELEEITHNAYVTLKTNKLLDFGVEKVIWFFKASKKIMIAAAGAEWQTFDWDVDVEIVDEIICNVGTYLRDTGSQFA